MLDPSGSSVNSTHNLANHLAEIGCEIEVYTAPHWQRVAGGLAQKYRQQIVFYTGTQFRSYGARTRIMKLVWRLSRFAQHIWVMLHVCWVSRKFDIVHTQILPVPLFDSLCLRFISRRTPIVCTVHELVPHGSRFRRLTGMGLRGIYRAAAVLFVFVECTRNRLIGEYGIPADRILKVQHGNAEHMKELRPLAATSDGVPIVLFLGGIRADKGLDVLIRAAAHLRSKVSNFKVVVAGVPGYDIEVIRKLVMDLGLQNSVEFQLGFIPENEFADHLRRATIVALPYRRIEQSGIAIAACTFGKAMVATRCGGLEELITESGGGLLVPIDDAIAFADALAVLLTDDEKRRRCEQQSRKYADGALSWETIAAKTRAGYEAAAACKVGAKEQICARA